MSRMWKTFFAGATMGVLVFSYMMGKNRRNGEVVLGSMGSDMKNRGGSIVDAMADVASQAAETMDSLSLRARTLGRRMRIK